MTSEELLRVAGGEPSALVRERVLAARQRQARRGMLNALLSNAALREYCALDVGAQQLVADAVNRGGMSARGVHRALRVARTIADLSGSDRVNALQLAEALQYRTYEGREFSAPRWTRRRTTSSFRSMPPIDHAGPDRPSASAPSPPFLRSPDQQHLTSRASPSGF